MLYKISENPSEQNPEINALREAIAFAAVLSSWVPLQNGMKVDRDLSDIGQSVDFVKILQQSSFRCCDWTCKFVADFLFRTYSFYFPAVYQAVGTSQWGYLWGIGRNVIIRDPRVAAHIYAVVAGTNMFYGISPNNYGTPTRKEFNDNREPPNPYNTIFIGSSPQSVLDEIASSEGGEWRLGDVPYYVIGEENNLSRFALDKQFPDDKIFEAEQNIPAMQIFLQNIIRTGRP